MPLNMMKVDVLALGMLTCIRKCFDLIADHKGKLWELATVPQDVEAVYDMLCRGESLGVFQVESRAQMNMLPRLKPRVFYDLVIEVAIVRPGPIQGDMVHPYLKRRKMSPEDIEYPYPKGGNKDELKKVLHKTLGVPLFQEQAMRIAIEAAEFTSEEANGLRRAMATFRNLGTIGKFESKMVGNMIRRGYDPEFANNCFNQIKGFGSYGFPESHAAAFAQLVYISSWLKHFHPDAFCCGLLNSQPMGFYAPAQIVSDARTNGVEVRAIDVSFSHAQNTLEEQSGKYHALRLGFRQIDGFKWADPDEERLKRVQSSFRDGALAPDPESRDSGFTLRVPRNDDVKPDDWAERIVAARARRPFTSLEDFARDTALPKRAPDPAGGCRCVSLDRARPPRGTMGGAAIAGRHPAAAVRNRGCARAAGRECAAVAADAAAGAGGGRLSDHPAVAEGPPDGISTADVYRRTRRRMRRGLPCQRQKAGALRRCGAGAAASGQRQGRGVHDAGRRDRHRQYRGVAEGDGTVS